jgi:hypothetical protein
VQDRTADSASRIRSASTIRRALAWARARGAGVLGAALVGAVLIAAAPLGAQEAPPPPPEGAPPPPPPGGSAPGAQLYGPEQLDQMLAPIALYPDDLLGAILIAATYPLEVVQADRWLQEPNNASLSGTALAQELQSLPWDPSVKSLVAYPQVLSMMDNGLDWTEALGDAFLAQQPAVMDSVQRLRARARTAGTLQSTPQEQVMTQDGAIEIAPPPDTGMEYVPVYDPQSAYGAWPYPDYPPEEMYPPGYGYGTFMVVPILVPYWGWDRWDWRHHHLDIDNGFGGGGWNGRGRGGNVGGGVTGPAAKRPVLVPWHHDPAHRGGVPYRDPGTRAKFVGTPDLHAVRSGYRGYTDVPRQPAAAPAQPSYRPAERPVAQPAYRPPPAVERPAPMPRPEVPRAERRAAPAPVERAMPPAFESYGRGAEVHVQEQRGFASRASPPAEAGGARAGGGTRR